ncbi:monoglyceride lipase-like [Hordeum vulgare]|nr:monoglyceride lipase-like [Hordeum vulgare]
MVGSMQAADAAGRISALLSLLALRRILTVLQPMLLFLLLLLPFRWRAPQVDSAAIADAVSASSSGKKAKAAVVLRI